MQRPDVILYTRRNCHLCDDAKSVLNQHGLSAKEVDIDSDAQLARQYDVQVPVVVIDGKERFRGRVDEMLLRRLLSSREG